MGVAILRDVLDRQRVELSVSSADRVWVWPMLVTVLNALPIDFQYPRRIECGCGPSNDLFEVNPAPLSVSSADRVWVWPLLSP